MDKQFTNNLRCSPGNRNLEGYTTVDWALGSW